MRRSLPKSIRPSVPVEHSANCDKFYFGWMQLAYGDGNLQPKVLEY